MGTDINENTLSHISITPNPTTGWVQLKNIKKEVYYRLFDVRGKILKEGFFRHSEEGVDLHVLPNGLYFLNLSNDDSFLVKKIIKQ